MNKSFDVTFVGLKQGSHQFKFEVGKTFFDAFPYSLLEEGDLIAELTLDKKETIMIANFFVAGNVKADCSRCNEPVSIKLKETMTNYYKFGTEIEEDENLFVLPPDEYKINVAQQIYELITVALPPSPKHKKSECNEEMVKLISKYQRGDNKKEKIDPRWEKLNKLN
tara:strand:- start:303 stop:803 length:501 start_codon:yes stop_codon:yes gene_type:complete